MLMLAFSGVSVLGLESAPLLNFGAFLFIVPFFIFSAFAGQLADKFEMSRIIRYTKLGEVAIMLTAGVALWFNQYLALLALLFLMGTQSALFGPAKYAILPKRSEEHTSTRLNSSHVRISYAVFCLKKKIKHRE